MPKTLLYAGAAFLAWKMFGSSSSSSSSSERAAAEAAAHQRALDDAAARAAAPAAQNNTVNDLVAVAQVGVGLIGAFANAFANVSANASAGKPTETRVNPDNPGWG